MKRTILSAAIAGLIALSFFAGVIAMTRVGTCPRCSLPTFRGSWNYHECPACGARYPNNRAGGIPCRQWETQG